MEKIIYHKYLKKKRKLTKFQFSYVSFFFSVNWWFISGTKTQKRQSPKHNNTKQNDTKSQDERTSIIQTLWAESRKRKTVQKAKRYPSTTCTIDKRFREHASREKNHHLLQKEPRRNSTVCGGKSVKYQLSDLNGRPGRNRITTSGKITTVFNQFERTPIFLLEQGSIFKDWEYLKDGTT